MGPTLAAISDRLAERVDTLTFGPPTTHVYNPLDYARASHHAYLERYGSGRKEVVLLGMNPGPWGMAQTGVPFGDVVMVRDWMEIDAPVGKPGNEHPKRPIDGFDCPRNEVSGTRLWGWARDRFGYADTFFERFFVVNYCPLCFMEDSGRNRTPDKLPAAEREPLYTACDDALRDIIEVLKPEWVIGVGAFAETRAKTALDSAAFKFGRILHPSPASPVANRGWAPQAEKGLEALGVQIGIQ